MSMHVNSWEKALKELSNVLRRHPCTYVR